MPHKAAVAALVDESTAVARRLGAVNCVVNRDGDLFGGNTDGEGFVNAINELWPGALHGSILILGSGPAARAIALSLWASGMSNVSCWSRNEEMARAIAPLPKAGIDLVVSALPPAARIMSDVLDLAKTAAFVFDLNYNAGRSPVADLPAANRSDGLPLLLHQGILSFEWWTGRKAPVPAMRAAILQASAGR
jgi:shikimate dehydrogenase